MHFAAVIASHRPQSNSLRLWEAAGTGMTEACPGATFDIIELWCADIRPCQACGHCGRITGRCAISVDDLAEITARLARADGIIIVSPHYAPIPAKLSALLERLESTHFFASYYAPDYRGPLTGIPYGIIGHGAGPEVASYKAMVLDTIENACSTIGLTLVRREGFPDNGYFVPAQNSPARDIYPPQQVYAEGYEKGLREYGADFVRRIMSG